MKEAITHFFLDTVGEELCVFFCSMLPIIELRGAIPLGAGFGLPWWQTYLIAVIGNMLPVPLILLLMPKILDFLGRFQFFRPIVDWLRRTADKHSKKVIKNEAAKTDEAVESGEMAEAEKPLKKAPLMTPAIFLALMLFVALPIPGTGAWSGSLVAALFSLSKKYSFLAVLCGVIICATIMTLASYGVLGFLSFLI